MPPRPPAPPFTVTVTSFTPIGTRHEHPLSVIPDDEPVNVQVVTPLLVDDVPHEFVIGFCSATDIRTVAVEFTVLPAESTIRTLPSMLNGTPDCAVMFFACGSTTTRAALPGLIAISCETGARFGAE